jgi:phage gpG-like protein
MSSVEIEHSDLTRNVYRLNGIEAATERQKQQLLLRSIIKVEEQAKKNAPVGRVRGGSLRQRINWKIESDGAAVIRAGVVYGRIQEFGGVTKPHMIYAKPGKALMFPASGGHAAMALMIGKGANRQLVGGKTHYQAGAAGKLSARGQMTGMMLLSHVHHPGSKIKPKHYTRNAFETCLPAIQEDARKMLAGLAKGGV